MRDSFTPERLSGGGDEDEEYRRSRPTMRIRVRSGAGGESDGSLTLSLVMMRVLTRSGSGDGDRGLSTGLVNVSTSLFLKTKGCSSSSFRYCRRMNSGWLLLGSSRSRRREDSISAESRSRMRA